MNVSPIRIILEQQKAACSVPAYVVEFTKSEVDVHEKLGPIEMLYCLEVRFLNLHDHN